MARTLDDIFFPRTLAVLFKADVSALEEEREAREAQQRRDADYRRWTSGFVPGAFAPVPPRRGRPPAPRDVHGARASIDGWQLQPAWKGQRSDAEAQRTAAMAAYLSHHREDAPEDIARSIKAGAEAVSSANGLTGLPDTGPKLNAAHQAMFADARAAVAAGTHTPEQEELLASGFRDPSAYEEDSLPDALKGAGYPEPKPGEAHIPPPGSPMPHERLALDAVDPWPAVEAKPLGPPGSGAYEINGVRGDATVYPNPEQGQCEKLANDLYRAVGVHAPFAQLVSINGQKALFTHQSETTRLTPAQVRHHPQVGAGFAMDAILANHDVLGNYDTIRGDAAGQAYRMKNGGALSFHTHGVPKSLAPGDVSELDTMRDPDSIAGRAFKHVSTDEVAAQIALVDQTITPRFLRDAIAAAGFSGVRARAYLELIGDRIGAARAWAEANAPEILAGVPPSPWAKGAEPGEAKTNAGAASSGGPLGAHPSGATA